MIDHKNKLIFIHISKCAGTSIESAFGVLKNRVNQANYDQLYGWCDRDKLFLHHATPQQLFDLGHLDMKTWNDYYKFIIIRNPWDRCYSDYVWMLKQIKGFGKFQEFLKREGPLKKILTIKDRYYRGDHLNQQSDYLFLNHKAIMYDKVLHFENLSTDLKSLEQELSLEEGFFSNKMKISLKKFNHYSLFYNNKRKELVREFFPNDVTDLPYQYENNLRFSYFKNSFFLFYHFSIKKSLKKYLEANDDKS